MEVDGHREGLILCNFHAERTFFPKRQFHPNTRLEIGFLKYKDRFELWLRGEPSAAIEQICDSRRTTRATMAPIAKALLLLCLPLCILYAWILSSLTASTHRVFANWQKPRSAFCESRRDRLLRLFAERIQAKIFWHCAPYYLFSAHKHMHTLRHFCIQKERWAALARRAAWFFPAAAQTPEIARRRHDSHLFPSVKVLWVNFQKSVVLLIKKPALGHCYLDQGGEENANNNQKPRLHGNGCNKF